MTLDVSVTSRILPVNALTPWDSSTTLSASRLEEKPPVRCGSVKEGECLYTE